MNMGEELVGNITVAAKMSKRLITVADMLGQAVTVADVGCDHGYISIYLVQSGCVKRAIAMDVRKGPLAGAGNNIENFQLQNSITTRLSDGLKELKEGEADSLIIAGMGGKLMIRILEDGEPVRLGIKKAILQPQSELSEFREYIRNKGYSIIDEKIVLEEGKYYFPMKVSFDDAGPDSLGTASCEAEYSPEYASVHKNVFHKIVTELITKANCDEETAVSICNRFGEYNIARRDPLLKEYCEHGRTVSASILGNLDRDEHYDRYMQVEKDKTEIEKLLLLFQ